MKRFLIGATTALTALALAGGAASAQSNGYPIDFAASVAGESTCTAVSDGPPTLTYAVTSNFAVTALTLSFETAAGDAFGKPVVVQSPSGVIPFPTNGNGSNGGYRNDGWTITAGQWFDGPSATLNIVATVVHDNGTATAEAPITYDFEGCTEGLAPPPTTVPGGVPPLTPPAGPPTAGPPSPSPLAPVPPQQRPPLPRTGMSTFETGMRAGALLLIGGLGFVIVARRRRFAAVTSPTVTSSSV